jgi:hypothetical protein
MRRVLHASGLASFIAVTACFVVHCGSTSGEPIPNVDGGDAEPATAPNPPACPATAPAAAAPCAVEGLTCKYGVCAVTVRKCSGGSWVDASAGAGPGPGACPPLVPKDGTSCDSCSVPSSCSYPCTGGASVPTEATCPSGVWQVRQGLGACGGADAGCPASCKVDNDCASCPPRSFGGWSCNGGVCQFQG